MQFLQLVPIVYKCTNKVYDPVALWHLPTSLFLSLHDSLIMITIFILSAWETSSWHGSSSVNIPSDNGVVEFDFIFTAGFLKPFIH